MPEFAFQARDATGAAQAGSLEASSIGAAIEQIRSRGWLVVDVAAQNDGATESTAGWELPFSRPRSIHIELSLQQIALMLRGGLTLLTALNTIAEQATRSGLKRLWQTVGDKIEQGTSFSEALGEHRCIPEYVVRLVQVGEQTGVLDSVLVRSSQMMQSRREAKRDVSTAMVYPAIVIVAAIGVTAYMVAYLIPKVGGFLRSIGKELPAMTQMLLNVADFFQNYGLMILFTVAASVTAFIIFYNSESGRLLVDRLILRIPLFGRIARLSGTTTFAQSLGTLIRSGITVLEGLITVEQLHRNKYLAQCVRETRENVMQGEGLSGSLAKPYAFMPLLSSMTEVGERTGNLDEVLDEVAGFHEVQLQAMIRQLAAWVTPVVTIVVGGIVGFVYIAFFMALFAAGA